MLKHNLEKKGNYAGLIRQILCATNFRCLAEPRCSRAGTKILSLSALLNSGLASFSDRISPCDGKDCPENLQGSSYQKSVSKWLQQNSQTWTPLAKKGSGACPRSSHRDSWLDIPGCGGGATHFKQIHGQKGFLYCVSWNPCTLAIFKLQQFWNLLLWTFSKRFKSRETTKWTPRFLSPSVNIFLLPPSPTPSFGGLFQNKSQTLCHFNHWYFNNTHSWNKNCMHGTHPYSLDGLPWGLRQ